MRSFNGDGPMGFCARTVATTDAANSTARKLQQCNRCHRQTSITAGTIFDSTKLPLTVWFQAIYLMTQDQERGLGDEAAPPSGYLLQRRVAHQTQADAGDDGARPRAPAQRVDPSSTTPISVASEVGGKRGRGAPGKTPFVAAVQTNEQGHPLRMKLTVVEGFRLTEIAAWAQLHLGKGTRVVSDGLACFHGVTAAGCVHEPVVVGSGRAAVERPEFRWVNTILGNIKNALRGTYHAIRPKYAQRYLSEFEYRFNRRFDLPDIIPRLVYVALRTPPMPERLLKLRLA